MVVLYLDPPVRGDDWQTPAWEKALAAQRALFG
jgi:hypothetical protein